MGAGLNSKPKGNLSCCIVRTGTANTASVIAGLKRAGAVPEMISSPEAILAAERVVLPGVGTFGAAMKQISEQGLTEALRERIRRDAPLLAICVGMQLLFAQSEESPGAEGLSVLPGKIERYSSAVRCPQIGWNRIEAAPECKYLQSGFAYFANSYCLRSGQTEMAAATAVYDKPFVAALERGALLACQFHPELSGVYGLELIKRWIGVELC